MPTRTRKEVVFQEKMPLTFLAHLPGNFKIDVKGNLYNDNFTQTIPPRADEETGELFHLIDGDRISAAILVALAYKPIYIPRKHYPEIGILFEDDNPSNLHPLNLIYKFNSGPIEHDTLKGFYYVPGYTSHVINRKGESYVIDRLAGELMDSPYPINGYEVYTFYRDSDGFANLVGRHRALCLTFKQYGRLVRKMDVNHIDGIRGNDDLDNLEWTTRKQNCDHAYSTGLREENRHNLVRNIDTGSIAEYYSIADCARALGKNTVTIFERLLDKNFGMIYEGKYQHKYKDDPREWVVVTHDNKHTLIGPSYPKAVMVRNIETNEVSKYETASQCARKFGINSSNIQFRCKSKLVYGNKYQFAFVENFSGWPEINYAVSAREIQIRDINTGEVKSFPDQYKAAQWLNISQTGLGNRVNKSADKVWDGKYQIRYYTNEDWPIINNDDLHNKMAGVYRPVKARHIEGGKVIIFDSIKDLAKYLGATEGAVAKFMRRHDDGEKEVPYKLHVVRYAHDNSPWPEYTEQEIKRFKHQRTPKDNPVICVTGDQKEVIYPSVGECAKAVGCTKANIATALRKKGILEYQGITIKYL